VFFDYNAQFFIAILNYLRAKKFATTENPALPPKVPKDQLEDFKTFVQYLGLSDEIFPREKFNMHSTGVTLEEDGIVAVHDPDKAEYRYVLGQNIYRQGTHSLKLKLEMFQDNFWMFVGILKKDVVLPKNDSYAWTGSYGWGLGNGTEWKNGSHENESKLNGRVRQRQTVELVLDCDVPSL
jgi:hypothetical protein